MIFVGIDPGLNGALAAVERRGSFFRFVDAVPVPVAGVDAKRRVVVLPVIRWLQKVAPDVVGIERAQAFPGQGRTSVMKYGRAVGRLEACVEGLGIDLVEVEASSWKKHFGLVRPDGEKDAAFKARSRAFAAATFPEGADRFSQAKDEHVAEAALIARYLAEKARR